MHHASSNSITSQHLLPGRKSTGQIHNPTVFPASKRVPNHDIHNTGNQVALQIVQTPFLPAKVDEGLCLNGFRSHCYERSVDRVSLGADRRGRQARRRRSQSHELPRGFDRRSNRSPKSNRRTQEGRWCLERRRQLRNEWHGFHSICGNAPKSRKSEIRADRSSPARSLSDRAPRYQRHHRRPKAAQWTNPTTHTVCESRKSTRGHVCCRDGNLHGRYAQTTSRSRRTLEFISVHPCHSVHSRTGWIALLRMARKGPNAFIAGCDNSGCLHRKWDSADNRQPQAFSNVGVDSNHAAPRKLASTSLRVLAPALLVAFKALLLGSNFSVLSAAPSQPSNWNTTLAPGHGCNYTIKDRETFDRNRQFFNIERTSIPSSEAATAKKVGK